MSHITPAIKDHLEKHNQDVIVVNQDQEIDITIHRAMTGDILETAHKSNQVADSAFHAASIFGYFTHVIILKCNEEFSSKFRRAIENNGPSELYLFCIRNL